MAPRAVCGFCPSNRWVGGWGKLAVWFCCASITPGWSSDSTSSSGLHYDKRKIARIEPWAPTLMSARFESVPVCLNGPIHPTGPGQVTLGLLGGPLKSMANCAGGGPIAYRASSTMYRASRLSRWGVSAYRPYSRHYSTCCSAAGGRRPWAPGYVKRKL